MNELKFPLPAGVAEIVPASRWTTVCRVENAELDAWIAYGSQLEAAGFRRIMKNSLPGGEFCSYVKEEVKLSVSYLYARRELRVFSGPTPPMPDFSRMGEKKFEATSFTMFGTHSATSEVCSTASGMGLVLRLTDGRLVVVDGGWQSPNFDSDYPDFVQLLRDLSGEEKPRVALWVITHSHEDHYTVLSEMKPEDADIQAYMMCLPVEGVTEGASQKMMRLIPNYAEKNIPPHAGDHYDFGDARMDILYCCEEAQLYNPRVLGDGNNQSTIFTFTVAGQKIMVTGDAYHHAEDLAMEVAGDEISCEICQIAHHGRTSPKDDHFYEAVAPKVALWPGCYAQIDNDLKERRVNTWIFESGKCTIMDHYVAYDGTVTLDLPYTPKGLPYCSEGKY
ncbi:MAG: hypothetical protein IJY47_02475 [Clostridia bacterium]|nr:hypothetical protein [Clostridia bacterium]